MFLEKTAEKVKGFVEMEVFGFFTERFLNLAMRSHLHIWDIQKIDDATAIFKTDIEGYRHLSPFAQKTGCKLMVKKKKGIPFYIWKRKKRKLFGVVCLCAIIGIYYYNLHIWHVNIVGDFTFPIEEVRQELAMENVKVGVLQKSLDTTHIKNDIYMRRHDIAFIGISFKGTTCTVEIVEANLKPKEDELEKLPCHMIAEKEGMIYQMNTLEGKPMVKVGDMVKSGDILISGVIVKEGDTTRYVNSKGDIWLKTWYTSKKVVQMEKDLVSPTGRKESHYCLKIKNYPINFRKN